MSKITNPNTKSIYLDTEFTGLHKDTSLISIGIVTEDGKEFYAELTDYKKDQVDDWIQKNVIDNLIIKDIGKNYTLGTDGSELLDMEFVKGDKAFVAERLTLWLESLDSKLQLVSDCYAYDYVLFADLFGHALKVPDSIFYIPIDLSTMFYMKGIDPDTNREEFSGLTEDHPDFIAKHNALHDAQVIRHCVRKLEEMDKEKN